MAPDTTPQVDLFGDPISPATQIASGPGPDAPGPVNDMQLIEHCLAVAAATGYHTTTDPADPAGRITRCDTTTDSTTGNTSPVPDSEAAAVRQLVAAGLLAVHRPRWCPFSPQLRHDHGPTLRCTRQGTTQHHRWRALQALPSRGDHPGRRTA